MFQMLEDGLEAVVDQYLCLQVHLGESQQSICLVHSPLFSGSPHQASPLPTFL